jgi:hypothetical protein
MEKVLQSGRPHPWRFVGLLLAAVAVIAVAILGFVVPVPHAWSFSVYSPGQCPEGCGVPSATQNFPNGSYVIGTWQAVGPVALQIRTTSGIVCPNDGTASPSGGCSQPFATSGSFGFTSVGGPVIFSGTSEAPENLSVSGSWNTYFW